MDVASKLQAFITQYTDKAAVGDTPQNIGQCVGLIEVWLDQFSLKHIWGNATDLPTNAPSDIYTVVNNTPTNSPATGDIFVLHKSYGQAKDTNGNIIYYGHTGIVISADVNSVTLFEQNDPLGTPPKIKTYSYTNDCQWIHPKIFTQTSSPVVTDQQVTDQLNAQIQATNACQTQLREATAQAASLQTQLTTETEQVQSLQEQLKNANTKITSLQTQLSDEQKEIINLNTQIEQQASSNKDYASEIYTLTHDNANITTSFNSVIDGLGISRTSKTLEQITKDALSKEDDIDILLKAAGVTSGIMHNVAKALNLDDATASDQQVANSIITYVKSLQGKLQNLNISIPQISKPTTGFNLFKWLGLWQ